MEELSYEMQRLKLYKPITILNEAAVPSCSKLFLIHTTSVWEKNPTNPFATASVVIKLLENSYR